MFNMPLYSMKIAKLWVSLILLALFYYGIAETEIPTLEKVFLNNDKEHTWTSFNYPGTYPNDAGKDLLVTADKGYSIVIVIDNLDIDGFNGDFLAMKPGESLESEGEGKVFTFSLRSARKYAIHTNSVYFRFQVVSSDTKKTGFKLRYWRVGEIVVTTTESPSTGVTWPSPSGSESIYYTGFIHGKNQNDFANVQILTNLKTALSGMATKYCEYNNIITTEAVSEKNVQIIYLAECPDTWPDSEVCVKVRFALPILYRENSLWNGYQLNTDNLKIMWNQYGDDYLRKYDMKVYEEPDNKFVFEKWIVIFCVILILFLVLLLTIKIVLRYISNRENKKRRLSDVGSIMSQTSRNNKISLTPHPNQVTPPLFENDYSFNTYDPDDAISRANYNPSMGNQNFSYLESDDDSDIDVYNPNFSGSHHNDVKHVNKETDI